MESLSDPVKSAAHQANTPGAVTANTNGATTAPADAKPDVDMAEPTSASPPANPTQPAVSDSGPPANLAASHDAMPRQPALASAPSTWAHGTPTPLLPTPQGVSHIPPSADRGAAWQSPALGTGSPHKVATTLNDAAVQHQHQHHPQATQGHRQPAASTQDPQTQTQSVPSLSQQISENPVRHLSNTEPVMPPVSVAQAKPPAPPPSSLAPLSPRSSAPNAHVNKLVTPDQGFKRSFGGDVRQSAVSPAENSRSSSQQTLFREPHTPSAMDPYTVDNIFTVGGYHLPDPTDDQVAPTAYVAQCNELYSIIRNMHPSVVRRVIRDTWQTSLAGSEAHSSFVMNVVTHKCSGSSARLAINKFGKDLVKNARSEIMSHFTPSLLAEVEDLVVDKAPDSLLDKAMEKRLNSIPARPLLNMLARSERLGYDESDIIPDSDAPSARPMLPSDKPSHSVGQPEPTEPAAMPLGVNPSRPPGDLNSSTTCHLCGKQYFSTATRDHHMRKKICQKPRVSLIHVCPRCDQSFATSSGFDYHNRNKVCGGNDASAPVPALAQPHPHASSASPHLGVSSGGSSPASFASTQLPARPPPATQPMQRHPGQSHPAHQHSAHQQPTHQQPAQSQHINRTATGAIHGQGVPGAALPPQSSQATPDRPRDRPLGLTQSTPRPGPAAPGSSSQTSPSSDPYGHLTKDQHNSMNQELADAEVVYGGKMDQVRASIADPLERTRKLESLKNSFATKQSMVRKKYGVRLRERRSRAVIEQERMRMSGQSSPLRNSPNPPAQAPPAPRPADVHANKRARASVGGHSVTTQSQAVQETPTRKHAASADVAAPLSGGLAASSSAAETTDPTRFGARPPAFTGSHMGFRSGTSGSAQAGPSEQSPMKSLLRPGPIELSSDSDSDSDGDVIPAQLPPPPPRASQNFSRPVR